MNRIVWGVIALPLILSLAGCVNDGGSGSSSYTPKTHEFTLEVKAWADDSIALYTLNDGITDMRVVAAGFSIPGQKELVVPNPEIRVREGDTIRLKVINNNPLPHTFHLHGGLVDWEMDGVPFLNQMPIMNGQSYTYVFKDLKAGSYFYHCHVDVAHHMDLGMYGAFIVEEIDPEYEVDRDFIMMLDEWDNCHVHGNTDPLTGSESSGEFAERVGCFGRFAQDNMAQNAVVANSLGNPAVDPGRDAACDNLDALPDEVRAQMEPVIRQLNCDGAHSVAPIQQSEREWYPTTYPVYAPQYNTFLINGKAFPDTEPLVVAEDETVLVRLMNVGDEWHAMHLHGHNFLVVAEDGYPLESPYRRDTLSIGPGERFDIIVDTDNPGYWAFHDHVGLNVMNDSHGPGGMFTCLAYDGFHGIDASEFKTAIECNENAIEILKSPGMEH